MEKQACKKCGDELELNAENFHKSKNSKSGFVSKCKTCANKDIKDRKRRNNSNYKPRIVDKTPDGFKICRSCLDVYKLTSEFWHQDKSKKDGFFIYCKTCSKEKANKNHKKRNLKRNPRFIDDAPNGFKTCPNCFNVYKLKNEHWYKKRDAIDGFMSTCKICNKNKNQKYHQKHKEKRNKKSREYYREHKKEVSKQSREYYHEHKEERAKCTKKHSEENAKYSIYWHQLFANEIREVDNDLLEVKCKHCNKWFKPINQQVRNRVNATNGKQVGENHFYCSDKCKDSCEVYGKKPETLEKQDEINAGIYKIHKHEGFYTDSELSIWSNKVRGNASNTCEKCGSEDNLEAHHISPKALYPEQALDTANGRCLCMKCHDKAHKEIHKEHGPLRKCDVITINNS